jgi:hypothetical protein
MPSAPHRRFESFVDLLIELFANVGAPFGTRPFAARPTRAIWQATELQRIKT